MRVSRWRAGEPASGEPFGVAPEESIYRAISFRFGGRGDYIARLMTDRLEQLAQIRLFEGLKPAALELIEGHCALRAMRGTPSPS